MVSWCLPSRLAALLTAFARRTGCPLLVNTSFNVRGEPIVCSPTDALFYFGTTDIDCLVLQDFLLDRSALPACWPELLATWERRRLAVSQAGRGALSEHLYTFV